MTNFGDYLKELRGNRSLREMEKITGLSHTYLSTLEKGYDPRSKKKRHPTPEVLKKISNALNVNYFQLMKKAGYIKEEDSDMLIKQSIDKRKHLESVIQSLPFYLEDIKMLNEELNELKNELSNCKDSSSVKEIIDKIQYKLKRIKQSEKMFEQRQLKCEQLKDEIENLNYIIENSLDTEFVNQIDNTLKDFTSRESDILELESLLLSNQKIMLCGKTLSSDEKKKHYKY